MMSDVEGFDDLDDQVAALESTLGGAISMTSAFEGHLDSLQASMADTAQYTSRLESGFSGGLRRAFDGVVLDGMKLSDALGEIAQSMINTAYSAAVRPVTDHFGGLLADGVGSLVTGLLPFEKGGSFSQGRVMPFAKGGIVSGPMNFPMRGGMGLMGEAGPEAIMPLSRGSDGKLGVRTQGSGAVNVTMNITTPDVTGFQRSQGQIAAQMGRALGRGRRNA
jgi:phage-related minor tail protein